MKVGGIAVEQLRSIISRVERLEEEKSGISADIREVFAEAKGNGFDVKAIRKIIKLRGMDAQEREEAEAVLDTYCRALGMTPDLFDEPAEPAKAEPTKGSNNDEIVEENYRAAGSSLEAQATAYT